MTGTLGGHTLGGCDLGGMPVLAPVVCVFGTRSVSCFGLPGLRRVGAGLSPARVRMLNDMLGRGTFVFALRQGFSQQFNSYEEDQVYSGESLELLKRMYHMMQEPFFRSLRLYNMAIGQASLPAESIELTPRDVSYMIEVYPAIQARRRLLPRRI